MCSAHALRVVSYDDPIEPTLQEAFEGLFLPWLRSSNRSRDTIQSYERYMRCWTEYWASREDSDDSPEGYRTVSPVLTQITARHLNDWRTWLVEVQKFSTRNVNKYVGAIEAILARCESRGAIDAQGRYAILKAPKLGRLTGERKRAAKLYFRFLQKPEVAMLNELAGLETLTPSQSSQLDQLRQLDHLSRLYRACTAATWPTRDRSGRTISTHDHWRAAIVMYAVYGFRTEELISHSADSNPITWGQISWHPETPASGHHATNPHGWFWYVPEKQAWAKSEPLVLPLSQVARDHLRRILPWPSSHRPTDEELQAPVFNWARARRSFYPEWQAIVDQAGFTSKKDLSTGQPIRLLPKHLRKTCDTWHNYYRPGIAPLITGHADRDLSHQSNQVVADHYDNAEFAIVEAINELPVPEAWLAPSGPQWQQQLLF